MLDISLHNKVSNFIPFCMNTYLFKLSLGQRHGGYKNCTPFKEQVQKQDILKTLFSKQCTPIIDNSVLLHVSFLTKMRIDD